MGKTQEREGREASRKDWQEATGAGSVRRQTAAEHLPRQMKPSVHSPQPILRTSLTLSLGLIHLSAQRTCATQASSLSPAASSLRDWRGGGSFRQEAGEIPWKA